MRLCVYVCVVVEGKYTCKTGIWGFYNNLLSFFVVVEGVYTFKSGNFGNEPFCFGFFCCRGYAKMLDRSFLQQYFFGFFLLLRVCPHVRLEILATIICVYVCVVLKCMYT